LFAPFQTLGSSLQERTEETKFFYLCYLRFSLRLIRPLAVPLVKESILRANLFRLRGFGGQLEKLDLLGASGWRESKLAASETELQQRRSGPTPTTPAEAMLIVPAALGTGIDPLFLCCFLSVHFTHSISPGCHALSNHPPTWA
jgi:hypothetical protein